MRRLRDKVSPTDAQIVYHETPIQVDPLPIQPEDAPASTNLGVKSRSHGEVADEGSHLIVYIGEEGLTLTNILMTQSSSEVPSVIIQHHSMADPSDP